MPSLNYYSSISLNNTTLYNVNIPNSNFTVKGLLAVKTDVSDIPSASADYLNSSFIYLGDNSDPYIKYGIYSCLNLEGTYVWTLISNCPALEKITLTSLEDGHALVWDNTNSQWINKKITSIDNDKSTFTMDNNTLKLVLKDADENEIFNKSIIFGSSESGSGSTGEIIWDGGEYY